MKSLIREPFDAIVFDAENTLTSALPWQPIAQNKEALLESNNQLSVLRKTDGKQMQATKDLLSLLHPSFQDSVEMGELCVKRLVQDAKGLLHLFHSLGKQVFINAFFPEVALVELAQVLGVSEDNVFGIPIYYNSDGSYKDFDRHALLDQPNGKRRVVEYLKKKYSRVAYIGGAPDDLMVSDLVAKLIGFGGVKNSDTLAKETSAFLRCPSLAPLVYLCLTDGEIGKLGKSQHSSLFQTASDEFVHKRILLTEETLV